jgi:signal transduction histidine kinase
VATARTSIRALENALHLDSPLRAPLDRAQRELHRMANTMQDTLRLARSGKLSTRRVDLWIPLRNALKTATPDAAARSIWIEPPPFGRAPVWINGDEEALEQLFLNLLLNAVQETESGGRITAAVRLADDAVVSIADTGRGIPQDALDRVFEPFYSTKPEGAGLGLAIAWRTAAAHGGRLTIESAVGRGTTVDVALPLADSASELRLSSSGSHEH